MRASCPTKERYELPPPHVESETTHILHRVISLIEHTHIHIHTRNPDIPQYENKSLFIHLRSTRSTVLLLLTSANCARREKRSENVYTVDTGDSLPGENRNRTFGASRRRISRHASFTSRAQSEDNKERKR